MAIAVVQTKDATPGGTGASASGAFTSNNVAGNCLIAGAVYFNGGGLTNLAPTVTDTQGNTWYLVGVAPKLNTTITTLIYFCPNCKAGANTVTFSTGQAGSNLGFHLLEISGLGLTGAFDNASGLANASSASINVPYTPLSPNEFLYIVVASGTGGHVITLNGWTTLAVDQSPTEFASFYTTINSLSAVTAVLKQPSATAFYGLIAGFKVPPPQLSIPSGQISLQG